MDRVGVRCSAASPSESVARGIERAVGGYLRDQKSRENCGTALRPGCGVGVNLAALRAATGGVDPAPVEIVAGQPLGFVFRVQ